jgi:4-hydroxy-tetrahydrodipicolinate reductase
MTSQGGHALRAPYRVAIWGPGDVGSICVREIGRLPELEVVGALVYSAEKDGVDIGTLAGADPVGVTATRDLDQFLALDCDVVVHTARDLQEKPVLDDFVALLEAGKNVITSQPYNYLPARDPSFADTLRAAALRGGATFYAGGINPDFIGQRWALTMAGLSNDIQQIKIEEYFDCVHQANAGTLELIGLGGDPAAAMDDNNPALVYQRQYWSQLIEHLAASVGVELSRIEPRCYSQAAPMDLESPVMSIKKGQTGLVSYESTGYVGDCPFIVIRVGWYLTSTMKPEGVVADDQWVLTIEGRPSVRCVLDLKPSFQTDATAIDGEPAAPGYLAFGICLLQAIPSVVAAPSGIMTTALPAVHWKRDMRLATVG